MLSLLKHPDNPTESTFQNLYVVRSGYGDTTVQTLAPDEQNLYRYSIPRIELLPDLQEGSEPEEIWKPIKGSRITGYNTVVIITSATDSNVRDDSRRCSPKSMHSY